jgi:hypothetical protein
MRTRPVHSDKLTRLKAEESLLVLVTDLVDHLETEGSRWHPNLDAVRGAPTPPNRLNTGFEGL